ncbi:MAG TPA: sensor domain-containing diguanylate cyclase [Planctomycetota bacterium]|jgi:diguanylate cyclase (GGDEF)-like protein
MSSETAKGTLPSTPPGAIVRSASASQALLAAVSGPGEPSTQLQALSQRALAGSAADVQKLVQWAGLAEQETHLQRRRLRKQQHDFSTLIEIIGQISARSLDLVAMQTYLLRTVSGHFATTKLLIVRRLRPEDRFLSCSAAQGMHEPACQLSIDSPLCQHALSRRTCFELKELAGRHADVDALTALGSELVVPLVQEVESPSAVLEGMLLLGARLAGHGYTEEDIEFLQVLGKMLAICLRNEALYRRSIIDDLTGVASRGHFDAQLSQELNRIATYGHRGLGLLMLDVDNFKDFNDTYGHQTGDRVLQELARLLVRQIRNVDLAARYGGEEFTVILLEIDREKVLEVAQRLRKSIAEMEVLSAYGEKLSITCSFGIACFPQDAGDKSTLIQLADEALYRSKAGGRNCVTMTVPGSGLKRSVSGPRPIGVPLQSSAAGGSPRVDQRRHHPDTGVWVGSGAEQK